MKGKDWLRDKFLLLGLSAIILGVLQVISTLIAILTDLRMFPAKI